MNIYSIPPLISSLLYLFFGIIVILKSRKKMNIFFSLLCLATFWWQFCWFILFNNSSTITAAYLVKIGYIGILLIPIAYYRFIAELTGERALDKILIPAVFILGIVFEVFLITTDTLINGFYSYFFGFYPKAGLTHLIFLILLSLIVLRGIFLLFSELNATKENNPHKHKQIKFVLISFIIFTFASSDFLVNYGISFYPLGFIFIMITLGLITYSIQKHGLMEIKIVNEDNSNRKSKISLEKGNSYLINDKNDDENKALEIFVDQVMSGKQGLYISRTNPKIIREKTQLKKTPMVWLTETQGENILHPAQIEEINAVISEFTNSSNEGIILLEGITYLTNYSPFNLVIRFLRIIKDNISNKGAILLIRINEKNLQSSDLSLLREEFHTIK
jgi:hypothetical protein